MKVAKMIKIVKLFQIALLSASIVFFLFGVSVSSAAEKVRDYQRAAEKIEITITEKTNNKAQGKYVYCDFKFTIKNNSTKGMKQIEGAMKIMDMDGNVLSQGTARFSGDFEPGSETFMNLSWEMQYTDDAVAVWETDFAMMSVSFEITEVIFDDYSSVEPTVTPYVKPCDLDYLDNTYNAATKCIQEEDYAQAIELLEKVKNYKDSAELLETCLKEESREQLKSAEVGNIVPLGRYEQDGDSSNGKEEIQWIVLAKEDDKLLLLSDCALEILSYDAETYDDDASWKASTLREWLNSDFLDEAFGDEEANMIVKTDVVPSENEVALGEGTTSDKVFILNAEELEYYLPYGTMRNCKASDYALTLKSYYGWSGAAYWLRSSSDNMWIKQYVNEIGEISNDGIYSDESLMVRPAIWITVD